MTVTSRKPVFADDETDRRTVRLVELLRVTELMLIPLPEIVSVAPLTKFVPVMVMSWAPVPRAFVFGLIDVIVGRAVTLVAEFRTTDPPSGFVTVTVRAPSGAFPATST